MKRYKRTKIRRCDVTEAIMWLLILAGCVGLMALSGCDAPEPANFECCPGGACEPVIQVAWFSAEWCEPCKQQAPYAVKALEGVEWKKIDIDREPTLAANNKITAVPTYVIFIDGKERGRASNVGELRNSLSLWRGAFAYGRRQRK